MIRHKIDAVIFDDICSLVCPHCRNGSVAQFRPETAEYIHQNVEQKNQFSSIITNTICWANGLRKSGYAP